MSRNTDNGSNDSSINHPDNHDNTRSPNVGCSAFGAACLAQPERISPFSPEKKGWIRRGAVVWRQVSLQNLDPKRWGVWRIYAGNQWVQQLEVELEATNSAPTHWVPFVYPDLVMSRFRHCVGGDGFEPRLWEVCLKATSNFETRTFGYASNSRERVMLLIHPILQMRFSAPSSESFFDIFWYFSKKTQWRPTMNRK